MIYRTRHISECKKTTSPPGTDPITPPVKEDITTNKPPAQVILVIGSSKFRY